VTLLLVVVGILIVAGVAVLAVRDQPLIEDDPGRGQPLHWASDAPVTPGSLETVRFTVALRGYRMDEVDRVLDDATAALAQRDRRIAELEGALVSGLQAAEQVADRPQAVDPAGTRIADPAAELSPEESR
jgi:DivIVA domain-containing protein